MAGISFILTLALLLSVTWCKVLFLTTKTTTGLKLIEKKGKIIELKIDEDVKTPVKCYLVLDQIRQICYPVDFREFRGINLLMNAEDGYYWCEDKERQKSNTLVLSSQTSFDDSDKSGSQEIGSNMDKTFPTSNPLTCLLQKVPKCPQRITIDTMGRRYDWPAINIDEHYIQLNRTQNCIEDIRQCVRNKELELVLVEPSNSNDWDFIELPKCSRMQQINVTQAAIELQKLARKANVSANDLKYATSIVNQALMANRSELHAARQDASSVIRSLDSILTRVLLPAGESLNFTQPEVSVFVMNVGKQPPRGIALSNVSQDLAESSILRINKQIEQYPQRDNIDIAIILPDMPNVANSHLAVSFFNDDGAFREENRTTNSRIVSVTMDTLHTIDILFKPFTNSSGKSCVFWDFSQAGGMWSSEGCELVPSPSKLHDMCRCTHLTHFAEIISPSGSLEPDLVLDIISLVGCSLSLTGLIGIFITGALFWQWRAQLSNKILLHLSAAVALNMLIFLIAATGLLPNMCIPLGALLHYSILTSFCWMLVCAGLQFMRLVSVLGTHYTSHLLLKGSIFAWGAPLIPVSSLLIVDVELYKSNGKGLCYPGGLAFYLAVLCPVAVIIVINLIVFGTILHRLFESSTIQRHVHSERKLALRRIMTSLLLFFLLGLTWIFGLFAGLSKVLAYLFCITATLQGTVLFLFFVLGEKKSRRYWTAKTSSQKQTSTTTTSTERVALRRQETIT